MKYRVLSLLMFLYSLPGIAQSWSELTDKVADLNYKGKYEEAIPVAKNAIEVAKKEFGDSSDKYTHSLYNLGLLYMNMDRYAEAEEVYIQAVEIRKKISGENHPDYAESLRRLATSYIEMGKYEKAEPLLIQAKEILRASPQGEDSTYALCLDDLGTLYDAMSQFKKSEDYFKKELDILQKSEKTLIKYAEGLNNLAIVYRKMGRFEQAELGYMQARDIFRKNLGDTSALFADILNNMAFFYESIGDYQKAEPLFVEAKDLRKKRWGEDNPDYTESLNNLASLYLNIGQYEKAEPLYVQACEIQKGISGGDEVFYATILGNLASLYITMGQYEKAMPLFTREKEVFKEKLGEQDPSYAKTIGEMGIMYEKMGQYEKARLLNLEANEIYRKVVGENSDYATSLNNLAQLYKKMNRYDSAEQLLLKVNEIRKKIFGESNTFYGSGLNDLVLLYEDMNQYSKAQPLLMANDEIELKNMRNTFTVLSEKEKTNYLNRNIHITQSNNNFLYHYNAAAPLLIKNNFNLQLFFKSLLLSDSKNLLQSIKNSKDTTLKNLFTEWRGNKNILARQYSLPIRKRIGKLDSIEGETETLEKKIVSLSSVFKDEQRILDITMNEVQKNLAEDEAAIEFVSFNLYNNKEWTDSVIYAAYILRKDDSVPEFVPLFEERQLQRVFDGAGKTSTTIAKSLYKDLKTRNLNTSLLGDSLYKLIWLPLEPYLNGIKKISYSPAGKLYSIAYCALPVDNNKLLIDKYDLQQYTSIRQIALRSRENQTPRPASIALFGNATFTMDSTSLIKQRKINSGLTAVPNTIIYSGLTRESGDTLNGLPGTAQEVKKISDLFRNNKIETTIFTESEASEENLKALSSRSPEVLHIATHGFFLPGKNKKNNTGRVGQDNAFRLANDPLLRTGLILSGGNYAWSGKTPIDGVEDGIVTAYEISQLDLSNTELVVLSACETGLGDVHGNEGVFGLQRAFKLAGVKKMIVSLWQVPDVETAKLMTTFYSYWMNGKSIEEAFNQVQKEMRIQYPPYYWAGFELIE